MFEKVAGSELRGVLEGANPKDDSPAVVRPDREAADVGQAGRVDCCDEASLGLTWRLAEGRHDDESQRDGGDGKADPDDAASADHAPVPVLPGAYSGVPSIQRGQVAGPGS